MSSNTPFHESSKQTRPMNQDLSKETGKCLTVTLEALGIAVDPGSARTSSLDAVGTVTTLAKTTGLATSARESTALAVLVDGVHNPVDARIVSDLRVAGVD